MFFSLKNKRGSSSTLVGMETLPFLVENKKEEEGSLEALPAHPD